jgi:hypothetical protein
MIGPAPGVPHGGIVSGHFGASLLVGHHDPMTSNTRTKDGKVHVVHNGGEHLSGRLTGVTDRNR